MFRNSVNKQKKAQEKSLVAAVEVAEVALFAAIEKAKDLKAKADMVHEVALTLEEISDAVDASLAAKKDADAKAKVWKAIVEGVFEAFAAEAAFAAFAPEEGGFDCELKVGLGGEVVEGGE